MTMFLLLTLLGCGTDGGRFELACFRGTVQTYRGIGTTDWAGLFTDEATGKTFKPGANCLRRYIPR